MDYVFFFCSRLKCLLGFLPNFFFITASLAKREKVTGIKKKKCQQKNRKKKNFFSKIFNSVLFLFQCLASWKSPTISRGTVTRKG